MTFIPQLAFKNLARYKKRTMITAGAIAYGLMMFIFMRSLLDGIDSESLINLKLYETASGRITAAGYWEDRDTFPLEKSFDPALTVDLLEASDADYSPRITFGGSLIFTKDPFPEDGSIPVKYTALDPVRDADVFGIESSLSRGGWLKDGEAGLVIGHWLAEDIGADIGYPVIVETQTKDGYAQSFDLEIIGIVNCPNPEITRSGIFLPLSVADNYLEMGGDVTEMNVNFGLSEAADKKFAEMTPAVEALGLETLDWRILGKDFIDISQSKTWSTGMIIFMLLIIAAVGISNTMLMAVYERVRELGMMRALGLKDRQIRRMFLWEAAGIGILGGLFGVILGALINWPLVKFGIDYSFLLREANFGYRIQGQMYGVWDFPTMALAFVLGVVMAVFVASLSTRRILRMDIPASLRFQ